MARVDPDRRETKPNQPDRPGCGRPGVPVNVLQSRIGERNTVLMGLMGSRHRPLRGRRISKTRRGESRRYGAAGAVGDHCRLPAGGRQWALRIMHPLIAYHTLSVDGSVLFVWYWRSGIPNYYLISLIPNHADKVSSVIETRPCSWR